MLYGAVPPVGVITTDPSAAPLQVTLVEVAVAERTGGSVIVTSTVVVQPLASVTVKVYEPAVNPVCDGVMLYGAVPPVGVTITLPSAAPLQVTLVEVAVAERIGGSVIVTSTVVLQPLAS